MTDLPLKIVSLVPSWTETLLACGVDVVGRTRFCIHPEHLVSEIVVVGGTKSFDLKKILQLQPDFVVVDKQENTKAMADELLAAGVTLLITDVVHFSSLIDSCRDLGSKLKNSKLTEVADCYELVLKDFSKKVDLQKFVKNCLLQGEFHLADHYAYVIWKKPFMVIGQNTFISENFKLVGVAFDFADKYPEISDEALKNYFCFFSSEPFPFLKSYSALISEGYKGVVVDGEKLSWYGVRNLAFLEQCLK